jgi:hypothetical protein
VEEDCNRDRDEAVDGGRKRKLDGALNLFLELGVEIRLAV